MNNKPTPETDDLARGNHVVPTEWAQQLERERDEWYFRAHENFKFTLDARAERDEADKELHKQLVKYGALFDEAEKLRIERDELKEQLGQAMEIAEDFCGLVCYGMGWSGKDWSVENMRDARRTISWFHRLQEAVTK